MTAIPQRIHDDRLPGTGLRVVESVGSFRAEDTQLDRQLWYVQEHSPFYRAKWESREGRVTAADLRTLPFTTRAELQADQAKYGPFGSYLATQVEQVARVHRTSGSTGQALLIALSSSDIEIALERGAACFRTAGVLRTDLIVHCLNYCMWSGGVTDHLCLERAGAGVIPFGVGHSTELLETMLRLKPSGIHCTPSYLGRLEERLRTEFSLAPRDLGLRIGLFGGEPGLQDPAIRRRIEATWGIRAVDANYGMSEVLSIFGAECEARCGLHFEGGDAIHPEIRRPDSDQTLPFESGAVGELVLTHLQRQCQPLVRYRTSDVVEVLAAGDCVCGRGSPRFRVIGRIDDMIVVRGLNLFPSAIGEAISPFIGAVSGAFEILAEKQDPIRRIVIRVEAGEQPIEPATELQVREAICKRINLRPDVEFVPPGTMTRGDGKARRVRRVL